MEHLPILHLPTDRHGCTDCPRKHHFVNPNPSRGKTSTYSIAEALQGCRRYPARDRIVAAFDERGSPTVIGHLGEPVGPPHVAGEHCCALYPAPVIYTQ